MALFAPSASPAVVVREIDLTGGVPNVQSTTGAYVGDFRWGPVEQRMLIANEAQLAGTFASPDSDRSIHFHSCSYYLRYSGTLLVVREVTGVARNSRSTIGQRATDSDGSLPTETVKNLADFEGQQSSLANDRHTFIAKYPGEMGNGLRVDICPPNQSAFNAWAYKDEFDTYPSTSTYASEIGASNDEIHVVVIDSDGEFSGTRGTILERYPFLSMGTNARRTDGTTNYALDVINTISDYVWMVGWDSDYTDTGYNHRPAGLRINTGNNFQPQVGTAKTAATKHVLRKGVNSSPLTTSEYLTGFDLFEDKDTVEVDFLIAPSMITTENQVTVVNDLTATAQQLRKDCVVITSPARDDVVDLLNPATITSNIITTVDQFTNSSYLIVDNNFLKVYDKYNDMYIKIPAASSVAGICAATDLNRAPWFSPAGVRRGQLLGITGIEWSPTKSQRDELYKRSVNPIANIPGQGVLLYGDKTKLNRPSAFDRINVRRLFLILERAIARAAQSTLFEFNDEFTRAEFVNIVEPVLREVKGRRGITDFRVICDETNNTPAIIDRNEFVANLFIKPARSINYITLNFVAVRTGVDFDEVVGLQF